MKTLSSIQKNREEELRENNYYQDKPVMSIDDHVSLGKQTTLALLESMVERLEGEKEQYDDTSMAGMGDTDKSVFMAEYRIYQKEVSYLQEQITEIKL